MTALTWKRADDYHYRSECGRFSVSRLKTPNALWYIAWRLPDHELGATCLPIEKTDEGIEVLPTQEQRTEAFSAMQEVCEAEAA